MKIDTVRIRNFRCFEEDAAGEWGVVFRPNRALNLIIGPNGSGKTALLDGINIVMNAEGRSNQSLLTEYDFPYCHTTKNISIEVTLIELGEALGEFESDIQWIDPEDGIPIEAKGIELDDEKHIQAVVIQFDAELDSRDGEIKWRWSLPKFPKTDMEEVKELNRVQHRSVGYFRIQPTVSAGAFTLGQYSVLGRHLRKLRYRLGKLPENLKIVSQLPKCSLENLQCNECTSVSECGPAPEVSESTSPGPEKNLTLGSTMKGIVSGAKGVLGSYAWNDMNASLGPRYGELGSDLAGLTLGLRTDGDPEKAKFMPFHRLSTGEKYALSFALAKAQVPGDRPPVIVMEEPETALYPSAVAALLGNIQSVPTDEAPQIIISSHSESVLRCFSPEDIFTMGGDRQPRKLNNAIEDARPSRGPLAHPEYFIMPGGPSALFADKVLLVEGAHDAIVSGHLDRLSAKIAASKGSEYRSFSSIGWCILNTDKASNAPDTVQILSNLDKKVATLFDGDGGGKSSAEETKSLCPTFVYKSQNESNPTLEDALLLGLPENERQKILDEFRKDIGCEGCERIKRKCWIETGTCHLGSRDDRKKRLQSLCLRCYSDKLLFPPAFESLLKQLDSAKAGAIYELSIDSPANGFEM